ncbi:MAG: DUF1722 domain-containing protein [Acidobacteria bacterium]|nr:DUF1722 domain-containing protein [Acidobacteriota bacterium]
MEKIRIGISSCLLGEKVRFDGQHKWDRYITGTLGQFFEWVPVCPEVEYGLPIPRETLRLVGDPQAPRLMTGKTKIDHTDGMLRWADGRLQELSKNDLSGFIFKSKSPSSGMSGIKVYRAEDGMPIGRGTGIFAGAFMRRFPLIPVIDEGRLHDLNLRENFIEKVFVYHSWQRFLADGPTIGRLVDFHTRNKLLLMSHSPKHYKLMGQLVARARQVPAAELYREYIGHLMAAFALLATTKKNTNVLYHIVGFFKKHLTPGEKQELIEVIDNFRFGYLPLIAPIVLVNHYVRKYDIDYLRQQTYLQPHPLELQLRNHV